MRSNKYFLLIILMLIGILNFVDRQIMSILLEAIKTDLNFTDLQLGLLSGTLFALFYSAIGIPVARLADRWDRGKIVSIALFVWSAMTVLSGFAANFLHLALARIGVGIGESGVAPSSHSLIADRFNKKRATALAVYSLGGTFGIFLALSLGGWISDNYGWRTAFFAAGLPGVFLAFVAVFLIKDRRKSEPFSKELFQTAPGKLTLVQGVSFLWKLKAWRYAALGTSFTHIATVGIGTFLPSFIIRSYELSAADTGLIMALLIGVCGTIGSLAGGILGDKLSQSKGVSWLPWSLCISFSIVALLSPIVFLTKDLTMFIVLLAPYFLFALASSGSQFAIAQSVVKSDMRAMSSAVLILMINLFGLGLGPLLVGFFSDLLSASTGPESLRYAMVMMTPFVAIGAFFFYKSGLVLPSECITEAEDISAPH